MTVKVVHDIEGREIPLVDESGREAVWKLFDDGADVATLMPVKLEGGFEVEEVCAVCSRCHEHCTVTRGTVVQPFPWMVEARGIGYCKPCRFLTPIHARFQHRKGGRPSLSWLKGQQWDHAQLSDLRDTFWSRLKALFWKKA